MSRLLRSEILKMRSTRTNLTLLVSMLLLVVVIVLVHGLTIHDVELASRSEQRSLLAVGAVGVIFAALVGIMSVTSEYRHGTIRPTFVFSPRRERVVCAKLFASLLVGTAFGVLAEGVAFGLGSGVLAARGAHLALGTGDALVLLFGTIGAAALWAAVGAGVGALVRSQVGAILGVVVWVFVLENILFGLLPGAGRFAPGPAGQAMTGEEAAHLLPPLAGVAVLAAEAAALGALGVLAELRRDVG